MHFNMLLVAKWVPFWIIWMPFSNLHFFTTEAEWTYEYIGRKSRFKFAACSNWVLLLQCILFIKAIVNDVS